LWWGSAWSIAFGIADVESHGRLSTDWRKGSRKVISSIFQEGIN
jgi:hypothetical protein